MISESIKKKLDTLKSPENSQTNQSGFSASGMDKLTALKEEINKPVTPYEPKFDETLVESGKSKYESDKSQFQSAYSKWNRNVMGVASANWGKTGKMVEGLPDNRTGWEGVSDRYTADMDEDTLKSFYTLYDKDADSAIDFASEYQRLKAEQKAVENAQKNERLLQILPDYVHEAAPEQSAAVEKVVGGATKTGLSVLGTIGTPVDVARTLIDYTAGGGNFSEDVKVGNKQEFTTMSSQYQNDVKQAIAQDAKWAETKEGGFFREKLGIENFATAMFDVGYSSAQSALIMNTFGPAGLALFGTSAFSSSLQENLARDKNGEPLMDDGTALAKATIAGALEAITEKVSLEYVLKAKDSKGILTKIRNLIFAGLAEGSEELASEVGNYVTDALLRADESDFAKAKAKYLAYGEDDDTAAWHAILEFMPEAAYSTLSGFFSGLLMQGMAMSIQDVAANAGARSSIAEAKASGEYADLIEGLNASDYMKGKTPLTESSKKRDVVKAYRGATESIEQSSIKDRLVEEGIDESEAEATAKAIYDKANDYALSAEQKRLLGSQTAQKVLTEYTEGKAKSGTHKWVDRAVLSQQYATRSTKGESMFSETELGAELRAEEKAKKTEAELSARESALKVVSEQIGIDVKTLASQNINMPVETYENNLELAYSYGRAGYKLEDVAAKLGVDVSGIFGEAYQKGLDAYKSRSTEKSLRTKLGGKVNIVSQSELDKLNTRAIKETGQNPNYTEVNLSEMKKNNPMVYSAMEMVAKVYAPSIGRQVNFFSAENGVNGWRDASGIWINTDGVFEEYGKKGNVLGFFVHEFGHDLRADAPELFEEARKIIIDSAYKGNADALTKAAEGIILERGGDAKVDLEGAVEELVCDGLVKLTEDKEMLDKAFRTENLNFWKRFKNFLDKLVENFKKFLNTFTGANETARLLDVDAVQKLADVVGKYVDRIQAETKSSKSTETSTENKSETKQSITHKAITYEEVKKARDDYNDARIAYSKLEVDYNDRVRKIMSNGKSMDEQIPEIAAEEKRLGVDEAKKALDETRKKYETTDKAYTKQQLEIEKEKERAAIEKSGLSEADYFRKQAKKEFGLTANFRIAGYMLPNGSMLNFGGGSNTIRGEDHRAIGTIYTSDVTAELASAGMLKFMNDGNIRVMAETPGVDISSKVEPTAQQYANIKRMAASLGKEERYFSVDFTDTESKYGDVVGVLEYENNINPERIVNDIKHYYATGEVRIPSTVGKFYSVPHTNAAPTFYSQMGKVIEQQKANKFDARSLINMLLGKGVKADEIKWSGIATFLEGKKSVTKEELVDFVNKSKLQIEETWLGNGEWNESPELFEAARENVRQAALENLENQFEIGMLKNLSEAINTMRIDYNAGAFTVTADLDGNEITFFKENPRINIARWGDREYNLSPYNYRELLFRLPGATYTNNAMKTHWGEKASGILAHARIGDAWLNNSPTDPDTGEAYPMLFIEEIQSDWDNARHKREMARKFYRQLTDLMTEAKQNPGFEKADKRIESIKKEFENMGLYIYVDDGYLLDNDIVPYRLEDLYGHVLLESDNETDIYDAIRTVIEKDIVRAGDIPDAPYGDGKYVEYTLKKLLRTAAEEGYTKIGWTTGKQQEERWSNKYSEAYRIEYDQQMPKFLNKYGKQWGATVSQEKLDNGHTVWTFPINEAMRKSLIEIGQPLYSVKHEASSRMGAAMSNDIRDSIKHIDELSLSPRQYLAAATLETINNPADKAELRKIIDEYQTLDDTKSDLEHQIAKLLIRQDELNEELQEIQQTLSKTSAAKSRIVTDLINRYGSERDAISAIRAEIKDIEKQLKNLRSEQGKVTARLHDILTMPRIESIIEEQRQLVREYRSLYQSTKEADKIKLQELRERMNQKLRAEIDKRIEMRKKMVADYNERKKIDYYMPRIEATLKDLNKHLAKAPMPFRGPVLQFISMLDFRQRDKEGNVRLTRKSGNEVVPHQANLERERRLAEIEELLGKDNASYGNIENWFKAYGIELDEDLKTYITGVRNFLKNFVAANMVPVDMRAEDAAEIKSVYQFAKMLDRMLVIATKGYTDVALDQSKNSREIAEHIEPLERKNTKVSRLESFMSVDNAQPETIFDRLGEGGKKLFNILANGADRYAINRQIISDFAADWDKKQVREWQNPKELVSVPFTTVDDEGNETVENVPMTPAQMMTLYATLQDPDGWRHIIDGEGFQLDRIKIGADGKKGEQVDTTRKMTEKDYNALVEKMNAYDPNLIPFADKLHKFISDQGREWGNQVSIGRYGFEQFTQPKYFPLFTVEKGKSNTIDAIYSAIRQSFYGLLNRSFTKERLPNAVNALIIGDFFDIFIEHMSDMALYNAYALPVLEVNRFLNYVEYDVEKDEKGNEHLVEQWKTKDKLDKAFGTDIIENYIKNVFDSINGQEYLSRSDSLFLMGLKLRNRVAVTANVRVIVQQFFSIIRAGEVIPSKYLLQGGYNFKETRDEMYRYAPVALWKKQGNYNTDIKLPLKEELIGAETGYKRFVNAVSEYGMTPAEFMDEVAWTRIWHGVTEWVKNTNPGLSDEAFYDECNKRFRDIIYRTQVVDSVLQKSQFMRQQTFQARVLSSFKGEPTTSYNQLLRVVDMYKDAKQRGDLKTAWATIRPLALRAITAYCLNAIANAVVTSLVDMIRDDDDYETMWEKFIEALLGEYRKNTRFWRDNMTFGERVGAFTRWFQSLLRSNLVESFNPLDIPLLSDIFSLLQGYDADRADLMIAEQAFDLMGGIIKSVDGMDTKLVYDLVGAVSQLFGLPVQNVMRDSLATWNSVVGIWNELFGTTLNMKVQITPESAQSGYEALYDAMSKGKESRALELVTEIMDNVKDSDKAYSGITTQIRDAYKHNEITAEQAHDYLIAAYSYFDVHKKSFDTPDKLDKHIKDQVSGWDK